MTEPAGTDTAPLDDATLWERFRKGDDKAFAALQARYNAPLYDYLNCLTGDRAANVRLLTRAWGDAYLYAGPTRPYANVRTWLFALATAVYDDPSRLEAMGLMAVFDHQTSLGEETPPASLPPAVAALALKLRMPLVLIGRFGFRLPEAAQVCRVSRARGTKRLAAALAALDGGPPATGECANAMAEALRGAETDDHAAACTDCHAALERCRRLHRELNEHPPVEPDGELAQFLSEQTQSMGHMRGSQRHRQVVAPPGEWLWLKRTGAVLCVVMLLLALNFVIFRYLAATQRPPARAGRVVWHEGDVKIQQARENKGAPLAGEPELYQEHILQTGKHSRVMCRTEDGTRLLLTGGSAVGFAAQNDLTLGGGRLLVECAKPDRGTTIHINSPNGTLDLTDGDAVLTATQLRLTVVVLRGHGVLGPATDPRQPAGPPVKTVAVGPGQMAVCAKGYAPLGPLPVRAAPWRALWGLFEPGASDVEQPLHGNEAADLMPAAPGAGPSALKTRNLAVSVQYRGGLAFTEWSERIEAPVGTKAPALAIPALPGAVRSQSTPDADGQVTLETRAVLRPEPTVVGEFSPRAYETSPAARLVLPFPRRQETTGIDKFLLRLSAPLGTVIESASHKVEKGKDDEETHYHLMAGRLRPRRALALTVREPARGDGVVVVDPKTGRFGCVVQLKPAGARGPRPRRFVLVIDSTARAAGLVKSQILLTLEQFLIQMPQPAFIAMVAMQDRPMTLGSEFQRLTNTSAEQILMAAWALEPKGEGNLSSVVTQFGGASGEGAEPVNVVLLIGTPAAGETASLDDDAVGMAKAAGAQVRVVTAVLDPAWRPAMPRQTVIGIGSGSPEATAGRLLSLLQRRRFFDVTVRFSGKDGLALERKVATVTEGEPMIFFGESRNGAWPVSVELGWGDGSARAKVALARIAGDGGAWYAALARAAGKAK